MFRCHHTPPTATHGRAARWFWRLMRFGPVLTLLVSYIYSRDLWFFRERLMELHVEMEGWAFSSPLAFQINFGLLVALSCFAIAGVNAASLWFAWSSRFIALWVSGPFFLTASENILRGVLGCTFYNTPPVPALCQVKADLRLPFPDMWPLAIPWPLG